MNLLPFRAADVVWQTAIMRLRRALCSVVLACLPAAAAHKGITMSDLFSSYVPASPEVVWSPDGSAFVYLDGASLFEWRTGWNDKKLRLRMATLPAAKAESGPYTWRNRRVWDSTLQWFPNGQDLLVIRQGTVFRVDAAGTYKQLLAQAEDPKLSPDGTRIAYRRDHNLYDLQLKSGATRQLTNDGSPTLLNGELDWVYPEELDLHTAFWWSPDSRKIAFLQLNIANEFVYPQTNLLGLRAVAEPEHYPQAGTPNAVVRLGVISTDDAKTTWMHAGADPDVLLARVAWLPDSSSVALEVMPRIQNKLDLIYCDANTGTTRTILHEESKDWINIADNLTFLKVRPEFLWTSERTGFRHIYRYALDGTPKGQLTAGDWQVDTVAAVDEANGTVLYTSSENSPLEANLWSVKLDGGARSEMTKPGFDHTVSVNPEGTSFVDYYSSLSQPPATVLHSNGKADLNLNVAGPPNKDLLPVEIMPVRVDGTLFYAKLIRPAGFKQGNKYPAIVHVYGGPGAQEVRNTWAGADWDQLLASRGFVVWEFDNRGSTGRGHAFEQPIFHALGSQEIADQRAGLEYLLHLGFVDPKRIGVTGWSYGGYMTIRSLLLAPDLFRVGVAGAPVTDWRNYDTIYTERYMGLPQTDAVGYDRSSNVLAASKLERKLLILHNLEDDNVLFQNTAQMAEALERSGRQYMLQIYPNRTHHVSSEFDRTLYPAMTEFLQRNLNAGANVP